MANVTFYIWNIQINSDIYRLFGTEKSIEYGMYSSEKNK